MLGLHHVPVHVQSGSQTQALWRTPRKVKQQLLKQSTLGCVPAALFYSAVITLVRKPRQEKFQELNVQQVPTPKAHRCPPTEDKAALTRSQQTPVFSRLSLDRGVSAQRLIRQLRGSRGAAGGAPQPPHSSVHTCMTLHLHEQQALHHTGPHAPETRHSHGWGENRLGPGWDGGWESPVRGGDRITENGSKAVQGQKGRTKETNVAWESNPGRALHPATRSPGSSWS